MNRDDFLESSTYIDWQHDAVLAKARSLANPYSAEHDIVQACFAFVRDEIRHSWDYQLNPVTCKASDVLLHGTGYCYAKSHLLAALLRANGIPAGLCYQRLTVTDQPPYCLHGLNAVYLQQHGWYRIDARGNKPGVTAAFTPPVEALAFPVRHPGEIDFPEIWATPVPAVIQVLESCTTVKQVYENLSDLDSMSRLRSQGHPGFSGPTIALAQRS